MKRKITLLERNIFMKLLILLTLSAILSSCSSKLIVKNCEHLQDELFQCEER